jgi:serine/threonine protein phosphatase PrpC
MGLMLEYAVRSDVGLVRGHNEDAVFASRRMVAVADGVGGRAAGEVASRTVIGALAQMEKSRLSGPLEAALRTAVTAGNETIAFIADCRPRTAGMSTTLTAVALDEGYAIANIGDSRTYLCRDGVLTQLTRDDSFIQMLIDSGAVDVEGARAHPQRSLVMEVLDGDPRRSATVALHPARAGDRLLLCSDGLSDLVDDHALRDALAIPSRERCADALLALALGAGGRDNVSVIVADVVAVDAPTGWD